MNSISSVLPLRYKSWIGDVQRETIAAQRAINGAATINLKIDYLHAYSLFLWFYLTIYAFKLLSRHEKFPMNSSHKVVVLVEKTLQKTVDKIKFDIGDMSKSHIMIEKVTSDLQNNNGSFDSVFVARIEYQWSRTK